MKFGSVWTKAVDCTYISMPALSQTSSTAAWSVVRQMPLWCGWCCAKSKKSLIGGGLNGSHTGLFLKGTNVCVVNDFSVCDFSYVSQKNEWKSFSKPNHVVLVPKPNQTGNINDSTKVIIRWNMSTPCQQSSFWNWSRCCIQCITADLSVKPFKCKNCHLISEA